MPRLITFFHLLLQVTTSAHRNKPLFKTVVFQVGMGCAEYLLCPMKHALHSKLWTRGDSNHCQYAVRALGVVVLFLIGYVCVFSNLQMTLSGSEMSRRCVAILLPLNLCPPRCIQGFNHQFEVLQTRNVLDLT